MPCVRNSNGARTSGNCEYGTSPRAILVAVFRMYEMSTRTATCVFRHRVKIALAAKSRKGIRYEFRTRAAGSAPNTESRVYAGGRLKIVRLMQRGGDFRRVPHYASR